MRIAIPLMDGHLAQHFGHCQEFALMDVDPVAKTITAATEVGAPEHKPGHLPLWLKEQGVTLVIAGGLGSHAQAIFSSSGIGVITGASAERPETLVRAYLEDTLVTGDNACDH